MDEKTAKKLIDALDRNTKAQEEGNRLSSAALKISAKPQVRQPQVDPALKNIKNF